MKKIAIATFALLFSASIARAEMVAQFTSKVENKLPTDLLEMVSKNEDIKNVTFFSELMDLDGKTISHVWKKDGVEFYRKPFKVGGKRWRVWSTIGSHNYNSGDNLTVEVQDEAGVVLKSETLKIEEEMTEHETEDEAVVDDSKDNEVKNDNSTEEYIKEDKETFPEE